MAGFLRTSFQKRLVSALVLGPIAFFIVFYGHWPFALMMVLIAGITLYEWWGLATKTFRPVLFMLIGAFYIPLSFWCCFLIRVDLDAVSALLFLSMIWASDTGAYFFGKIIGGPKMASYISPNKTWAGYVGAVLCPALVMFLFFMFSFFIAYGVNAFTLKTVPFYARLFLGGAAIGVAGQSGDLLVSFLKRVAQAKDSSQLIPGHGGILDRVDSVMLSAPVFLWLVKDVLGP